MYKRPLYQTLLSRLKEPRRFLQVLAGPRQVGKTTLARQAMEGGRTRSHYASADGPTLQDRAWIEQQWDLGRLKAKDGQALLVLDEVQKVPGWSEVVKRLWDEDTAKSIPLKCVLLGSSPLLMQRGLTESLAGRFEVLHSEASGLEHGSGVFAIKVEFRVCEEGSGLLGSTCRVRGGGALAERSGRNDGGDILLARSGA